MASGLMSANQGPNRFHVKVSRKLRSLDSVYLCLGCATEVYLVAVGSYAISYN